MSEMEYHTWSLIKHGFKNDPWARKKEYIEKVIGRELKEDYDYYDDDGEDPYLDAESCGFIIVKDVLYQLKNHNQMAENDCTMTKTSDGHYDFRVAFYNGGGSFEEVLEGMITEEEEK